ncbi:MAG: RpiB/LacA/LacB family sugar-phosphate isomerase [Patescibacteria group bacterium]
MKKMTIFIGADHAGYKLKEALKRALLKIPDGPQIYDLSPRYRKGDDYPKVAAQVARLVVAAPEARGVLVCGSGIGMAIAANRQKGVRAFDAFDAKTVKLAREHNDANVLTLSGWRQNVATAQKLVETFLKTNASGAERHKRRIKQLG